MNGMIEMGNREDIVLLVTECIEGNASETDLLTLKNWISESPENRDYYYQIKNMLDIKGAGINSREILTDKALLKVQKRILPVTRSTLFTGYLQKAAAILLIPLLAGSFLLGKYLSQKKSGDLLTTPYNEVTAAFGTRSSLTLPDGSLVWLNAGSKLKYPSKFTSGNREVYLLGEAYFEVESEPSKPFIVKSNDMEVKATGTKFNVNTLNTNNIFEVTLVEGNLSVNRSPEGQKAISITKMVSSQHLSYDSVSGKADLTVVDTYKYIAWREGKLVFRNDPLSDVMMKIGYFYDVDIELRGEEIKNYPYRATFENETLSEILSLLKISTPVDYIEVPRTLQPDGTFTKKKIIIFKADEKI